MNVGNNNPNNNANNRGQRFVGDTPVVSPGKSSPRTPVGQHQAQPQQDPNAEIVPDAQVQHAVAPNQAPQHILIPAQLDGGNQQRGNLQPRELFPDNNNNNNQ